MRNIKIFQEHEWFFTLLNHVQGPDGCDARMFHRMTKAGNKIPAFINQSIILL